MPASELVHMDNSQTAKKIMGKIQEVLQLLIQFKYRDTSLEQHKST